MSSSPFDSLFGFKELSEVTGMTTCVLSTNLHRARTRREKGTPFNTDMPEPDKYIGSSPVWTEDTVRAWLTVRASDNTDVRVLKPVDPSESLRLRRAVPIPPVPFKPKATAADEAADERVEEAAEVVEDVVASPDPARKNKGKRKRKNR